MISTRSFEYFIPTKIYFENGSSQKIVEVIGITKQDRALLVADPSIIKVGLIEGIAGAFNKAGVQFSIFEKIEPNPKAEAVELGAEMARGEGTTLIVGIGGGSALDTAKGIALRAKNEGFIMEYSREGTRVIENRPLPIVAIPTTAGTGSEVTSVSVITDTRQNRKLVVASPFLFPKVALLDPLLTKTLPPRITAETGMDALTHAIESFTTLNEEPITDALSMGAIRLIANALYRAVANGDDLEARSRMLLGSTMAGMAFGVAGLGIAHSTAHALGGKLGIAHGLANAIMLPHVMRYNIISKPEKFRDIAETLGENTRDLPVLEAAYMSVEAVQKLMEATGIPRQLSTIGVKEDMIEILAKDAVNDRGTFPRNPRKASIDEIINIYKKAL